MFGNTLIWNRSLKKNIVHQLGIISFRQAKLFCIDVFRILCAEYTGRKANPRLGQQNLLGTIRVIRGRGGGAMALTFLVLWFRVSIVKLFLRTRHGTSH